MAAALNEPVSLRREGGAAHTEVCSGAEGGRGPGEDDDTDSLVGVTASQVLAHEARHLSAEGIALARLVQGQGGDPLRAVEEHGLAHALSLSAAVNSAMSSSEGEYPGK